MTNGKSKDKSKEPDAHRSSTRLAVRTRASKSTLSDASVPEITPAPRRAKRARNPPASGVVKKKKRAARTMPGSSGTDPAGASDRLAASKSSALMSVPSLDTIFSDEEDIEQFTKYFRVKTHAEMEAVAHSIVQATNKPRVTRKAMEERKRAAKNKYEPQPRPSHLKLNNVPKGTHPVPLMLSAPQLEADVLTILTNTPGAFEVAEKQKSAAAAARSADAAAASKQREGARTANGRRAPTARRPPPMAKKTSPKKGAVTKKAPATRPTRAKKAGKKGKSTNPAIDGLFRPSVEHKGYISCVNCEALIWPPNREKHLPKCTGVGQPAREARS